MIEQESIVMDTRERRGDKQWTLGKKGNKRKREQVRGEMNRMKGGRRKGRQELDRWRS